MDTEHSNEGLEYGNKHLESQGAADDLEFMRSAVEKTYKQVNPYAHTMIMWGIICMIIYPAMHLIINNQLSGWILPVFLISMSLGLCYILVTLFFVNKREKESGLVPHLRKQLGWIFFIVMVMHGMTWSVLSVVFNNYCVGDPGLLMAILCSISLCIMGVFHSTEWLYGGIFIFVGALIVFFMKEYGYFVLGFATGAGLIIPAILVQRNYRKQEKNHE